MIGSSKLGTFMVVFSIAAVVLYTAIFMSDWTAFTFYPALGNSSLANCRRPAQRDP